MKCTYKQHGLLTELTTAVFIQTCPHWLPHVWLGWTEQISHSVFSVNDLSDFFSEVVVFMFVRHSAFQNSVENRHRKKDWMTTKRDQKEKMWKILGLFFSYKIFMAWVFLIKWGVILKWTFRYCVWCWNADSLIWYTDWADDSVWETCPPWHVWFGIMDKMSHDVVKHHVFFS